MNITGRKGELSDFVSGVPVSSGFLRETPEVEGERPDCFWADVKQQ